MTSGADMLRDAAKVVEDRHKTYGPPTRNFENIAQLWAAYIRARSRNMPLDTLDFTLADVAAMMALVKIARLAETPGHFDSWTDIAGYAACGVEVACREAEPMPNIDHSPLPYWENGAKPNPSLPIASEDASDDDFNR